MLPALRPNPSITAEMEAAVMVYLGDKMQAHSRFRLLGGSMLAPLVRMCRLMSVESRNRPLFAWSYLTCFVARQCIDEARRQQLEASLAAVAKQMEEEKTRYAIPASPVLPRLVSETGYMLNLGDWVAIIKAFSDANCDQKPCAAMRNHVLGSPTQRTPFMTLLLLCILVTRCDLSLALVADRSLACWASVTAVGNSVQA